MAFRREIQALIAKEDHAGVVATCSRLLLQPLSRTDQVYVLLKYAEALMALNPEGWVSKLKEALESAIELTDDHALAARLYAGLSAVYIPLRSPKQIELRVVQPFAALATQYPVPDVARYEAEIRHNLGVSYYRAGDLALAEQAFVRALAVHREHSDVTRQRKMGETLHNLGEVYLKTGRIVEAKKALEEAVQLLPDNYGTAKVCSLRGMIARAEGDLAQAREWYRQGMAASPTDGYTRVDILREWAEAELAGGDAEQAAVKAKEALMLACSLPYYEAEEELEAFLARLGG